jgi:hypothetical protein
MKATKNFTGEYIKYPNGNVMSIYSQITKKGVRYYRYSLGTFLPVSKLDIALLSYTPN